MRNSLARRVLWVHVILLLALCGVLLRIFVIGQGEQYRQTAAAQSRYGARQYLRLPAAPTGE